MAAMFRRIWVTALILSLVVGALSCGGNATNNDQGTSFLALGYYDDADGEVGRSALVAPLFYDLSLWSTDHQTPVEGLMSWVFLGLQNRLSCQYMRVDRVECDYDIQGTNLTIPSDSHTFSAVIDPTGPCVNPLTGTDEEGEGSSEGSDTTGGNMIYAGIEVLSPDLYSFLNVYQNHLPQLPFRMTVTCRAIGTSQAGDTFRTNDVHLLVQFVDTAECCGANANGTPGFQNGTGTGGTFDSFGGNGGGSSSAEAESLSTSAAGEQNEEVNTGDTEGESASSSGVEEGDFVI